MVAAKQIHHCQATLKRIMGKLFMADPSDTLSIVSKIQRTLKWPFKADEIEKILTELERHKATFNVAVSVDTMEGLLQAIYGQKEVVLSIEDVKAEIGRIQLNKERQEILDFFGTFDSEPNQQTSSRLRQSHTGLWLTEGAAFTKWLRTRNARMWLSGIPGAGKTILAGSVIEETLRAASPSFAVGYHYCDYKSLKSQMIQNILASLAGQLGRQSEDCFSTLQKFYHSDRDGTRMSCLPEPAALAKLVVSMASCFEDVALIVDGLDESDDAANLTRTLSSLSRIGYCKNIRLVLLSRDEPAIRGCLDDFEHISIAAQNADLRLYVSAQLEERQSTRRLRIKSPSLNDEILERLVEKAGGMFRWVACQMDYLCELPSDADRRRALTSLPPDLNTTYERILRRINQKNERQQLLVQRTLHWLIDSDCHAPAPAIDELCVAVAINDGDVDLDPEAQPDEEEILRCCSSLIRQSASGDRLELAHFTVEEYLTSIDVKTAPDLSRYKCVARNQDLYKAKTCLIYLNTLAFGTGAADDAVSFIHRVRSHPFFSHAAMRWP